VRIAFTLIAAIACFYISEAGAACACRCIENHERAVCDSTRDAVPVCGLNACPIAPTTAKPADSGRPIPPGTYGCEYMREYNSNFRRYDWTELCPSSNRNNIALIRPGPYRLPVPVGPSSSAGMRGAGPRCDTDSDCPSGNLCTRRSTQDEWRCRPR
jgi:hypothetical protein